MAAYSKSYGHTPGFASTKAKLRCGIREENVRNSVMCSSVSLKSQIQKLECGEVRGCQPVSRASESWGPHWVTKTSWKPICVLAFKTTNLCLTGSQKCLIYSQHGFSFFIALRPGPTICCELSGRIWFEGSQKGMMRDCGDASAGSLAQMCRTQDPGKLPVSLSLVVWVCEARPGRGRRPIGPAGLTASP